MSPLSQWRYFHYKGSLVVKIIVACSIPLSTYVVKVKITETFSIHAQIYRCYGGAREVTC